MLSDQSARAQAIVPDQSFIVQAPAGSGKTELLTQRILSLLAHNAKSPESVLAITFTRKAAHEMRMRVMKALSAGQAPPPPADSHQYKTWDLARRVLAQDKAQGWEILSNPQRLQIMTIDSLCASLVRQMPVVSGMGGMPTLSDNGMQMCRHAAKTTLIDLLNEEDTQLQALLLHLDNRHDLAVELIASMLSKREQWLGVLMGFARHEALREQLEHDLAEVIERVLEVLVLNINAYSWQELIPLLSFAKAHGQVELSTDWPLPTDAASLPMWRSLYDFLFTQSGTVRKSITKRNGFPSPSEAGSKEEKALYTAMKAQMKTWLETFAEDESAVQAWKDIPYLPEPTYTQSQWAMLEALLHVLPHACAQLALHQQTHGEMDFSGMAQAALQALGHHDDPSALTLKLDYQLQHILVDEFQDTSLLQYSLLEKLVAGWTPEEGRTLFLVGDPMQSIYRFRQAEVGLFLRVQQHGLGDLPIQPLHLNANFRSDPLIIDWINQHAPLCFSARDDINFGAIAYSPSVAAREPTQASEIGIHATGDILPCLQNILANDAIESVAILVRARSHLSDISLALQNANIPYQAVELEHLSVQPLVQDLMSLTRALVHLADSMAWLSVLRAPFCGFSLEDITLIRQTDLESTLWDNLETVNVSELSNEGQSIWSRVHPALSAGVSQRMSGRLSKSVEKLWLSLGGPACLQSEADLRLAESFFHLLSKHERGGTVPDMSLMLQELDAAFVKSTQGEHRLQVMTLHKAKGLEFDAVLLPELQKGTRQSDQPLLLWEQLPADQSDALLIAPIHPKAGEADSLYQFLKYTREQKDAHQLGRLLYVGLTRAKRQLHLFARLAQNSEGEIPAPKNGSLLSLLWPRLAEEFMSVYDPTAASVATEHKVLDSKRLASTWQWPTEIKLTSPHVSEPKTTDNQVASSEYSYASHLERQLGVMVHRMLYKLAVEGLTQWSLPSLKSQCKELGVSRGVDQMVETINSALKHTLNDPRGRWILDAHSQHEAEAQYQDLIIDRTFVDEKGVRWIIDYKTSQPEDETEASFYPAQYERYRTQLDKYAEIFAERGEATIRCALYFPLFGGWFEWPYETLKDDHLRRKA